MAHAGLRGGGGVLPGACPVRRPARYFCINYPDCNPGSTLHLTRHNKCNEHRDPTI